MGWLRKGSKEEDEVYSEAAETIVKGVCDADMVNKIELHTGRNIRDQTTVDEVLDTAFERDVRRFDRRN